MELGCMHVIMEASWGSLPSSIVEVTLAFQIVLPTNLNFNLQRGYTSALLHEFLLVLCSIDSRSNNERLVQLACDGGRSLALLRFTKHCVCEIER
jgi:hypothetical protein